MSVAGANPHSVSSCKVAMTLCVCSRCVCLLSLTSFDNTSAGILHSRPIELHTLPQDEVVCGVHEWLRDCGFGDPGHARSAGPSRHITGFRAQTGEPETSCDLPHRQRVPTVLRWYVHGLSLTTFGLNFGSQSSHSMLIEPDGGHAKTSWCTGKATQRLLVRPPTSWYNLSQITA